MAPVDGPDYVETSVDPFFAPQGFYAEDIVGIELLLDEGTGQLSILFHFSYESTDGSLADTAPSLIAPDFHSSTSLSDPSDHLLLPDSAATYLVKCTVTKVVSITQNSGSSTINVSTGLLGGSRTSPSTSTTTSTTVTVEGRLIGGVCRTPSFSVR